MIGLLVPSLAFAIVRVKGYFKPSTGIYVLPHSRTSPNRSKLDNWSTKGNINPSTGKKGTVNPYKSYKFRF
jgi:hypothetical protein